MARHAHDGGLAVDLSRLVDRRGALRLIGGAGLLALAACSRGQNDTLAGPTPSGDASVAGSTPSTGADASCARIPSETAGPFPGSDVLSEAGVVRPDIRTSIGSSSGTADGIELKTRLTVVSLADGCRPLPGAAVYLWHCDRDGAYSMYGGSASSENYLRGVQAASDDGRLTFTTVFPGAYQGRWPHMHFEVYPSTGAASTATGKLATSQLALPEDACAAVYDTDGYQTSARNFQGLALDRDGVFRDGWSAQMARMSGDAGRDLTAELTVAV